MTGCGCQVSVRALTCRSRTFSYSPGPNLIQGPIPNPNYNARSRPITIRVRTPSMWPAWPIKPSPTRCSQQQTRDFSRSPHDSRRPLSGWLSVRCSPVSFHRLHSARHEGKRPLHFSYPLPPLLAYSRCTTRSGFGAPRLFFSAGARCST